MRPSSSLRSGDHDHCEDSTRMRLVLNDGLADFPPRAREENSLEVQMVSVTTPQLCHPRHNLRHYVNASVWLRANKYLWTIKFEYHINFMCHGTVLRLFSKHLKMSTPFFAGGPYKNSQRAGVGWRVLACQPLLETNIILILKGPRRLDSGSFFLKECDSGLLQIRIIFLPPLRFESGGKYVCIFGLIL